MARANDYVDPDYDRRLAEYKALKAKLKQQGEPDQFSQNQSQAQHNSQDQNNSDSNQRPSSNQIRRY